MRRGGATCIRKKSNIGRIYLIRNVINGKGYVGQTTKTAHSRFNQHKYLVKNGSECALHRAMRKEVATCELSLLSDLERHYIKFFGTYSFGGHGYNLTEGGGGSSHGRSWLEESLRKLSDRQKGNSYAKGYKHTESARARISELNKLRKPTVLTQEAKLKIAAKLRGHPVSAESRAKISASQLGKSRGKGIKHGPRTEKTKAKIAASMRALRAAQRAAK